MNKETNYVVLSRDNKQADYYFKRAKAILNPIVDHYSPFRFELNIGKTRITFAASVDYYSGIKDTIKDPIVMRDNVFEEKLMNYMKTVKDIKELKK